ncbi:MAG: NAD(P)/FAD-dependent oxidoreductase, partial [Chloroflexota bacterium]|nr:NAD(P)/FAD-dependent oxidoreductase [Chloroflexota bacterium]
MQANSEHHEHDIIIVGAGVVGAMVARFLSRYDLDILWIEKESDICTGATSANSAIIHGGYAATPGTLKAEMNTKASPMWDQLAAELNFSFSRCGTYVVAIGDEEREALKDEAAHGAANGIPVEIISGDEMRRREPLINPEATGALHCPVGGICDPWDVTIAAAENAVMNGVALKRQTSFEDFIWDAADSNPRGQNPAGRNPARIIGIRTNRGDFYGRWVINAAGIYSDSVMHKAGVRPEFKIKARRGEYYILDRSRFTMNSVLFPVPTKVSKGIVVTTTLHGNVIIGPNAEELEDKEDTAVTAAGLDEVWNGARKLVPTIDKRDVIAIFAGLR